MQTETQRVLAGSLNLLSPSDKTPENDAIDLFNFRVDQAGVLRGAETFIPIASGFGGPVHTVIPLSTLGSLRYGNGSSFADMTFGANNFLVGAGGSLYMYSPVAGVQLIASGFDGQPLSIVFWNAFFWVMNRAKRIALYPPGLLAYGGAAAAISWLPTAPTTPCTVADDPAYSGAMSNTAVVQYFMTFSNDYVTGPTNHFEESFHGPVSAGATPSNGFMYLTGLPLPGQSPNGFGLNRTIYRQGGTLPGPYSLPPAGVNYATGNIGSTYLDQYSDAQLMAHGQAWNSNTAGSANAPSPPTVAPVLTPGQPAPPTSGFVGNRYVYYVTFYAETGLETNPGPASATVISSQGQIKLTHLPTTADTSVIGWRIYRSGGTLGGAYQVVDIPFIQGTGPFGAELIGNPTLQDGYTYVDTATDLELTELGILMPGSDVTVGANDPPPAALGVEGPYFNYMLAFDHNRLFWSQDGVPVFPGSALASAIGNWVNVGQGDDDILAITLHSRVAIIYKQRSIWRLTGDPVTGILEQTSSSVGAAGRRAVANCGSFDLVLSKDGLFLFDLDAAHKQSQKIDPVFYGTCSWTPLGASNLTGYPWNPVQPVCGWLNGTALLSDGYATAFLFHAETRRISAFTGFVGAAITAVCSLSSAVNYFIGDRMGNLCAPVFQTRLAQSFAWQTRFLDQGLGDQNKVYDEIVIDAELNGAGLAVYLLYDNTNAAPNLATLTPIVFAGTTRQKFYIPLQEGNATPVSYPHISVRMVLLGPDAAAIPPAIHGLYIYWAAEPRDSDSLNSQVVDFHSAEVSLARKLAVDILGVRTITIETDEPNGLASRYQTTVGTEGVRQWLKLRLPPNIRGRLWRIRTVYGGTQPTPTSRMYSVRAWMRKTGTSGEEAWQWVSLLEGTPHAGAPDAG